MLPSALIASSLILLGLSVIPRPTPPNPPELRGLLVPLWWLNRLYTTLLHRVEIENEAPFPGSGPAILVSNHTCGIDHLLLQSGTRRVLGFMIALEFYDHPLYHPFCKMIRCIPAKRDGRDQTALRLSLQALKDGHVLGIFPEGRINAHSGRDFLEAKPGTGFLALKAKVPVIPAYISGTPPTDNILKALRTPSHVHVVYGDPVDLSDLWNAEDREQERANIDIATDRMMGAIRALRDRRPSDPSEPSQ